MKALRAALASALLALAGPAVGQSTLSAPTVDAVGFTHPGYVAGRFYAPPFTIAANGQTGSATTTYFTPLVVYARVTIDQLGVNVTTLSAGGNFQLGVYSYAPAANTLTFLMATASGSTAATGTINAALTTPLTLDRGLYFVGYQVDNTTAVVTGTATTGSNMMSTIGSTDTFAAAGGAYRNLISVGSTFGTWPTPVTATSVANVRAPAVQFRVAP